MAMMAAQIRMDQRLPRATMSSPNLPVGKDGALLPNSVLAPIGVKAGDSLSVVASDGASLILAKLNGKEKQPPSFTGQLKSLGVADLFGLLNMTQKSGRVVVQTPSFSKYVSFQRGDVVFAGSSVKEDRLGHILYKTGMLSKEQWEHVESKISANKRFGAILLEEKLLTSKDLYEGVRYQIEEIVYSLFGVTEGFFAFYEGEAADEELSVGTLGTQSLLMEGFQRLDEYKLIAERIPTRHVIFRVAPKLPSLPLEEGDKKLLELIDGASSVDGLIRRGRLGEFNTYKILFKLLKMGFIEHGGGVEPDEPITLLESATPEDPMEGKLAAHVEKFNRLYEAVFRAVAATMPGVDLLGEANSFFLDVPEKYVDLYAGIQLGADGRLPPRPVLDNAMKLNPAGAQGGGMMKIAGLRELMIEGRVTDGLGELLNFLLFTVKNILPADKADKIAKEIRAAQKKG